MRPLVLPFANLRAASLPEAGGKAANLGELVAAGFPVPPGFCVTTAAYARAAEACGLDEVVERLAAVAPGDAAGLAALAAEARERLLRAPVDPAVAQAITGAWTALGDPAPVAVRSSATAEDLPGASFAGQQDTFLHVEGPEAVIDAVRRCWASLWSDRAVSYRAHQGVGQRHLAVAVVVQRMIDAAVAGVVFTANPVTGRRGEAVVDASWGLGAAVVSGAANPDHFVVDAATGAVRDRRLGDKRVAVRRAAGGGTRHEDLADGSATASLGDAQLAALAALGARVEAHYGAPQDLEFAFDDGGTLWLLQARPITTLYPLPARTDGDAGLRVYFSINVAQGVMGPFTPLGAQGVRLMAGTVPGLAGFPLARPAAGPPIMYEAGHRLFLDLTPVLRDPFGREMARRVLGQMEARSAQVFAELIAAEPALAPVPRPRWRSVAFLARAAHHLGLPPRALAALLRPDAARERALGATDLIHRLREVPADAPPEARVGAIGRLFRDGVAIIFRHVAPAALGGLAASLALAHVLGPDATEAELQILRRALPHNMTTEMDHELARWAQAIAADEAARDALLAGEVGDVVVAWRRGALPAALMDGFTRFLARWGDRALPEIDMGVPRWSEDPGFLVGALRNLVRQPAAGAAADAQFARAAAEAEGMVETLVARAAARSWWRGRAARFFAGRMRALFGLREAPKFNFVAILAGGRALLLPVAEHLVREGRLAAVDDLAFLDLVDLRAGLAGTDLHDRVLARRASYDVERRRKAVPRVLLSDGRTPEATAGPLPDGSLRGSPASPGQVRARARVVLDPVGAHLEPGEVLVAPSTDPGWTPLFLAAGGLVMEMGGAMSHGSVVAREFGIPAVVGVPGATARIATGDVLVVDGAAGTVAIEPGGAEA